MLPAHSEPGYEVSAWGVVQADGARRDGFIWFAGDVYHLGPQLDADAVAWRTYVMEHPETGALSRMRFITPNDGSKPRTVPWPTAEEMKRRNAVSREVMAENQVLAGTKRTKALAGVVASAAAIVPAEFTPDTAIPDIADGVVRQMALIAVDPLSDLKAKRDASEVAKAWAQIGNSYRAARSLPNGAIEGAGRELSEVEAKRLLELRNRALFMQQNSMAL